MDIGSAKPTKEEMSLVPHHMIDIEDPTKIESDSLGSFGVYKYSEMARSTIDDIISRGKIPLIVGGTGLYLDSIIYDIDFAAKPFDDGQRKELYAIAEKDGPLELHSILENLDPDSAGRIHPNNIKRVVRAIEAARAGEGIQKFNDNFQLRKEYNPILIGLIRDREELYERINRRVDILMDRGLLEEVRTLFEKGLTSDDYPMKGIGYKELIDHLEGKTTLDESIELIKRNSRHYAKRQLTWFKRYDSMKWFDLTGVNSSDDYMAKSMEIEEWLMKEL